MEGNGVADSQEERATYSESTLCSCPFSAEVSTRGGTDKGVERKEAGAASVVVVAWLTSWVVSGDAARSSTESIVSRVPRDSAVSAPAPSELLATVPSEADEEEDEEAEEQEEEEEEEAEDADDAAKLGVTARNRRLN